MEATATCKEYKIGIDTDLNKFYGEQVNCNIHHIKNKIVITVSSNEHKKTTFLIYGTEELVKRDLTGVVLKNPKVFEQDGTVDADFKGYFNFRYEDLRTFGIVELTPKNLNFSKR
jgi:hypothetical protein